jgi:hypothetical protein
MARTKEIALVLCLLVIAGATAIASEPLVPPVFNVKTLYVVTSAAVSGPSPGFNSQPGTLLLSVSANSAFGYRFTSTYVANAIVSVVRAGLEPLYPKAYTTNATGKLALSLTPSNYQLSVLNLPMNVSVPLEVLAGGTTVVNVTVTSNTYQATFLDFPSSQSDIVPAWTHSTIELGSYVALLGSSSAFLDLYYSPGSNSTSSQTGQELQTPLLVTASDLRSNATSANQWIAFQPERSIPLSGLSSVQLSVYGAYTSVATHGGERAAD